MVWISLILVSLPLVFYWLWPKKGNLKVKNETKEYNLYKSFSKTNEIQRIETVVYFEAGSSQLFAKDLIQWKEWITPYLLRTLDSILLIGSADTTGNVSKNRRLVKERVQTIRQSLLSLGVKPEIISSQCLEPIPGRTAKERERFRSVVVQVNILG
ncbi:hypothetical protein EHQ59_03100 [Leptospira kemamanensis]|uniref:OmpA-like domain-containing protein n=1 Tax=Leptospira kemamanensis TaxID=2484942 RepID=A0A4R9JST9_9LEPT|nr:OmpA family protein [Leptospira kemamanensis]TGL55788.1 hypothetical protein EHQ59_03100 [Leptospira kemamanensis]